MMQPLLNLLGLVLALPLVGWSILLLALRHTIRSTNVIELMLDLLLAYLWGVPLLAAALLAFAVAAVLRRSRRIAAGLLIVLNVSALAIVFTIMGPPPAVDEAVMLLPSLLSIALAAIVMRTPSAG